MMKYALHISTILFITLLLADVSPAFAQLNMDSAAIARRQNRPKPIKRELSVGFRVNSDGWSVFADRGTIAGSSRESDKFYDVMLWQLEFSEKKHPQETKRTSISSQGGTESSPFIYGKINNFYSLKLGYGKRKMIAGKPDPGTVAVHWVYLGGLSLGVEKPYYYEAFINGGGLEAVRYTDTTEYIFSDDAQIVGSAGFTEGISEVKLLPGIHGKTGLHFDFAASRKTKLAIETGISIEVYSRAVQLMAFQDHTPYFVNMYLSIQAGKRWPEKKKSSRR